jgi:two-component system, NarL family, response regulator LiaR
LNAYLLCSNGVGKEYQVAIRVLIADDHKVVRQGLRLFLRIDPDIEVVGEAANGAEAVKLAHLLAPDLVLMDILMPVMNGISATAAIRNERPEIEVLGLTSILEDSAVVEIMRAGAIGYLLKDLDGDELCRAIHAAAAGQVQLAPAALTRLMRELHPPEQLEVLTEREKDVLRLLGQGQSNKQIARALQLREETVKTHVSKILHKLGVQSRTQAVLYAMRNGLMSIK